MPPEVLKWFVVQAAKLKSSEPNAVLRRYAAMMVAGDRERFGQFVLAAWIAEDLRPFEGAEAEERALEQARLMSAGQQNNVLLWKPEHRGRPVEELYALYLPPILREPRGSAADSKGILAIAAACCGREAAPAVARYLKDWYGTRASQGKALIAMLAWIEHPSATQVLLSVGRRFRTKGLQDEATKQVEALAERKGWSVAELADRTVPTAGFDERGVLELSFGPRRFIARLGEGMAIALEDADGRKIAALPEPRQDDDAELAAQAKKALSAAKKDIKAMVKQQDERLYEALCTQRTWRFEDWDHFLNRHPVLRRRVQGLVWAELRDGKAITPFRPLDDGTLSGVDDAPVEVAPDARVGLVHDTHLAAGQVEAWLKHLVDYEVAAPFVQLGKGVYALPAASRDDRYVADFNGHVLEAFALRGRATQLGYVRQLAEDGGGWFCRYHKRFPSIGVDAVIEFSGNSLPEQNRPVALQSLSFEAVSAEPDGTTTAVALGAVPPVLLSECHHDLRLIAAEGTGYDPDWIETLKSWKA